MARAFTFYKYKNYKSCPLRHLKQDINRQKPVKMQDEYNTVYGVVVQKAFENFYNNQIWQRGAQARSVMIDSVPGIFKHTISKKNIFWGDHPIGKEELTAQCVEAVDKGLDVIKTHQLIGPYAKSEVNTYAYIDDSNQIGGRLDFVIRKGDGHTMVIDGKGSKHKDKYVDNDQLFWYALSFYLLHRKLPDSLWFWFYMFPEDPLKEIKFSIETLKELKEDILEVMFNIKKRKFKATPSLTICKYGYCPYHGECKEEADHASEGKPVISDAKGVIDLDFDD